MPHLEVGGSGFLQGVLIVGLSAADFDFGVLVCRGTGTLLCKPDRDADESQLLLVNVALLKMSLLAFFLVWPVIGVSS